MSTNDYDDDYDDDIVDSDIEPKDTGLDDDLIEVAGVDSLPEDKPEEDEKEKYSKKVQKRIDKLAYERNTAREEAALLAARLSELEKTKAESDSSTLEQRRQELNKLKIEALENGEIEEVVKIDDELFDIKLQQRTAPTQQPQAQAQQPEQTKPKAVADWESRNADIINDAKKLEVANKIYSELLQSGFEAGDPDTLAELDDRLSKTNKPAKREVPPSPGGVDRGYATGGNESSSFSSRDKSDMQDFGLDPNNPKHRAEWVKQKRSVRA